MPNNKTRISQTVIGFVSYACISLEYILKEICLCVLVCSFLCKFLLKIAWVFVLCEYILIQTIYFIIFSVARYLCKISYHEWMEVYPYWQPKQYQLKNQKSHNFSLMHCKIFKLNPIGIPSLRLERYEVL